MVTNVLLVSLLLLCNNCYFNIGYKYMLNINSMAKFALITKYGSLNVVPITAIEISSKCLFKGDEVVLNNLRRQLLMDCSVKLNSNKIDNDAPPNISINQAEFFYDSPARQTNINTIEISCNSSTKRRTRYSFSDDDSQTFQPEILSDITHLVPLTQPEVFKVDNIGGEDHLSKVKSKTRTESEITVKGILPDNIHQVAQDQYYLRKQVQVPKVNVEAAQDHLSQVSSSESQEKEDPFRDAELTEDEYVQPSECSTSSTDSDITTSSLSDNDISRKRLPVKRKLFKETHGIDCTARLHPVTAESEIENNVQDIATCVISSSRVEDNKANTIIQAIPPTSVSSSHPTVDKHKTQGNMLHLKEQQQTNQIQRLHMAMIDLHGPVIDVHVTTMVHKGIYKGLFFRAASLQTNDRLRTFVSQKNPLSEDHVCEFYTEKDTYAAALTRDKLKYVFESFYCLKPNMSLCGNEVSLSTEKKRYTYLKIKEVEHNQTYSSSSPLLSYKSKRHSCVFCGKLTSSVSRHLILIHKDEEEIKNILSMTPNSKERNQLLRKLRLEGDNAYNSKVRDSDRIPVRRPVTELVSDYLHCPQCKGLIGKTNFARHERKCTGRLATRERVWKRGILPTNYDYHKTLLMKLLEDLKDDEIGKIIRKDRAIQLLAIYYSLLHFKSPHQMHNSRAQLRRCARLLVIIMEMDNDIREFADCLKPAKYETLMNAIRSLCHMDLSTSNNEKPQLALQFGPIINHVVDRLKLDLIKKGRSASDPNYVDLQNFQLIHERDFKIEITRRALISSKLNKFRNKRELPSTEDIRIFNQYVQSRANRSYLALKNEGFSLQHWKTLSECVLCQVLIFNRRRVGEVSRMQLGDYKKRKQITSDQYDNLTRLQILLAKHFSVMFILAKRNRIVPVLLNPQQILYLNLLIEMRSLVGISPNNPFLFAFPNKEQHLQASKVLREYSHGSSAAHPDRLRSTYLRKQVATMSQLLNLGENEMQQLADFMGHDINVHKTHYRTPELVVEVTKLARFFSVVGAHGLNRFRGKSLDELEPELPPEDYDCDDVDEEDIMEIFPVSEEAAAVDPHETADLLEGAQSLPEDSMPAQEMLDDEFVRNQNSPLNCGQFAPSASCLSAKSTPQKETPSKRRTLSKKTSSGGTPKSTPSKRKPLISDLMHIIQKQGSPPRRRKRVASARWSESEKKVMIKHFGKYISSNSLPSMDLCATVLEKNKKTFKGRTPRILYAWVRNQKVKLERHLS